MTWKEKLVIRILMTVAQLLAPEGWANEVKNLAAHLSVHLPEPPK
jgi:hypothetical protein